MAVSGSGETYDFVGLNSRLLSQGDKLLYLWFPKGKVRGVEFCIGSLAGEEGNSLKVNIKTGLWADFRTNDSGRDLIALYAAIHSISMADAYRALSGEPAPTSRPELRLVQPPGRAIIDTNWQLGPVPEIAPLTHDSFKHDQWGIPSAVFYYRPEGRPDLVLCVVARYELQKGKAFCPWIWKADAWRPEGPPKPRPLYGMERLDERNANVKVIIVEGEKAADALRGLLGQPIITWMNGAMAARHADWSPLKGREVIIWPDADDAGLKAAQAVMNALLPLGAKCSTLDVTGYGEGWDAADWVKEQKTPTPKLLSDWMRGRLRAYSPPMATEIIDAETQETAEFSMAQRWAEAGLTTNRRGPFCNIDNAIAILKYAHERDIHGLMDIWYDTFHQRILYRSTENEVLEWADEQDTRLAAWMQRAFAVPYMGVDVIKRAVRAYARTRLRNAPKDWMLALNWDGIERLPDLIPIAFGTPKDDYHSAIGRCFVVGMVARIMQPGCIVKYMPVFEGPQDLGKGKCLNALGGEFYAEAGEQLLTKDFLIGIQGKLLIEIAELHAFGKADVRAIKGRISCRTDRFRTPYEAAARDWPRQCVFAGTTNDDYWNEDVTGAVRFWPVKCSVANDKWIEDNRDQLFAEAVVRYGRGERWWDVPLSKARDEQSKRREQHPWHNLIEPFIKDLHEVEVSYVLRQVLQLRSDQLTLVAQRIVGVCLRDMGLIPTQKRRDDGTKYRCFVRPSPYTAEALRKGRDLMRDPEG